MHYKDQNENNNCAGIYIGDNEFKKNMGCASTFGNTIISCNPRFDFDRDTGQNSLFE